MTHAVEFNDIQGIVRFGYRKLTECSLLLLAVKDARAAREWLAAAPVTSAVTLRDAPDTALQIALTHDGLQALGCAAELLAQFSMEFQSGPGTSSRARLLGDVGDSAPEHWAWGSGAKVVHLLLMLYARPGMLEDWKRSVQTAAWADGFHLVDELATSDLGGVEPFGFPDGLSQPELDWQRQRNPPAIEDTYTNRIALGEFLLGYPNEYRRYTDRPLLPAASSGAELLPEAEEQPGLRDFGRNGCYLVLRTLEQDVERFWDFVRAQAETGEEAEALAAAMVGRRKDGSPLASASADLVPGVDAADRLNQFRFDADPDGVECPFGAHIRRANPRNGDLPAGEVTGLERVLTLLGLAPRTLHSDSKASSRFHRVLRRGREYGHPPGALQAGGSDGPTGLHFLCLNANIARQFEFLQNAWLMNTRFDAMTDESDPLLGSREPIPGAAPTDTFSVPGSGVAARLVCGLPRFVRVRGAGYFFLPSLPALRYLAAQQ